MLIKLRLLLRKLTKHFQKTTTFKEKEFNNLNCQNNLKHIEPCKIDYGLRMLTANVLQNMILYSQKKVKRKKKKEKKVGEIYYPCKYSHKIS